MMARVPAETVAKIAGSASHKGNFYAVLDREDMNRSGVFPNWLDADGICQEVGIGIWEVWDETRLH